MDIPIVGLTFSQYPIENLKPNYTVYLVPEPSNQFDPNAVSVRDQNNKHIGYIPKEIAEVLAKHGVSKDIKGAKILRIYKNKVVIDLPVPSTVS